MKTNLDKLTETAGIDSLGFLKEVRWPKILELMNWAMLKGFWQGLVSGVLLAILIWVIYK